MNEFEEPNRFKPVELFHRWGVQRVFYKGDAPKQKETEHEKALAEVANSKWKYYQEKHKPIEDQFMKHVDSMDSEGAYDFVQGAASSGTQAAFAGAEDQLETQLQQTGANPNSGKYKAKMRGLSDAKGKAIAKNVTQAGVEQQDQYITGIRNVSMIGRGQATAAQAGLSDLASMSHREAATDAQDALAKEQMDNYAVGTAVGLGARAFGEYKGNPTKNGTAGSRASDYTSDEFRNWATKG